MVLQVDPDVLTAQYREQVLSSIETATFAGVLGLGLLVFLVAVFVVRKL